MSTTKTKTLSARMPIEAADRIELIAFAERKNRSALIRDILENYLTNYTEGK